MTEPQGLQISLSGIHKISVFRNVSLSHVKLYNNGLYFEYQVRFGRKSSNHQNIYPCRNYKKKKTAPQVTVSATDGEMPKFFSVPLNLKKKKIPY